MPFRRVPVLRTLALSLACAPLFSLAQTAPPALPNPKTT